MVAFGWPLIRVVRRPMDLAQRSRSPKSLSSVFQASSAFDLRSNPRRGRFHSGAPMKKQIDTTAQPTPECQAGWKKITTIGIISISRKSPDLARFHFPRPNCNRELAKTITRPHLLRAHLLQRRKRRNLGLTPNCRFVTKRRAARKLRTAHSVDRTAVMAQNNSSVSSTRAAFWLPAKECVLCGRHRCSWLALPC